MSAFIAFLCLIFFGSFFAQLYENTWNELGIVHFDVFYFKLHTYK